MLRTGLSDGYLFRCPLRNSLRAGKRRKGRKKRGQGTEEALEEAWRER